MAITATYKDNTTEIKNAYIRVERIWGCKIDGWSAWVHVYTKEGETDAFSIFSVNAPYVDGQNPFEALYRSLEKLPFIINEEVKEEVKEEILPAEEICKEVMVEKVAEDIETAQKPKKLRKKK